MHHCPVCLKEKYYICPSLIITNEKYLIQIVYYA